MKWFTVEEKPLVKQINSTAYELLVDDMLIVEVEFPKEKGYYVGTIDDRMQIVDCFGDDIGFDALDVSRWAFFNPPNRAESQLCEKHKQFPCKKCGTKHFDGCECHFCK